MFSILSPRLVVWRQCSWLFRQEARNCLVAAQGGTGKAAKLGVDEEDLRPSPQRSPQRSPAPEPREMEMWEPHVSNQCHFLGSQTGAASTPSQWWRPTTMSMLCCSAEAPRAQARTSAWPPSTVGIPAHRPTHRADA